jgi:hypothetical protein
LCFNDKLINALDTLGYRYSSTFSANDVLTNFPYKSKKDRNSYGRNSNIYELPMTISDVIMSDPISITNYPQRVLKWLDVTNRNKNNHAPTVLLIHPNRMFKLTALQNYISGLATDVYVTSLEDYGDYWIARDSIVYTSTLNSNTLTLIIPDRFIPLPPQMSFIINNGQLLDQIIARSQSGNTLTVLSSNWNATDKILYLQSMPVLSVTEFKTENESALMLFPNPCEQYAIVHLKQFYTNINCVLYDSNGKLIEQQCSSNADHLILKNNNYKGLYFARVYADNVYKGSIKVIFK